MSCNSFWLSVTYFHIELLIFRLSNFVVSPGTTLLRSPATVIPLVPAPEKGKSAGAGGGRAGGCLLRLRTGQGDSPCPPRAPMGACAKGVQAGNQPWPLWSHSCINWQRAQRAATSPCLVGDILVIPTLQGRRGARSLIQVITGSLAEKHLGRAQALPHTCLGKVGMLVWPIPTAVLSQTWPRFPSAFPGSVLWLASAPLGPLKPYSLFCRAATYSGVVPHLFVQLTGSTRT